MGPRVMERYEASQSVFVPQGGKDKLDVMCSHLTLIMPLLTCGMCILAKIQAVENRVFQFLSPREGFFFVSVSVNKNTCK